MYTCKDFLSIRKKISRLKQIGIILTIETRVGFQYKSQCSNTESVVMVMKSICSRSVCCADCGNHLQYVSVDMVVL